MQDLKVVLRINAETGKVKLEVKELGKTLDGLGNEGKKAGDKVSQGMKKAEASTNSAREVAKGMRDELLRLASVGFALKAAKETLVLADNMKLLDAKINLVATSQEAFNTGQEETLRIALETHTAIGTTVDLYTRLERSLAGQSVAQQDVLQITETINKALAVSGATAAETSSVITQLSQGLAAGALRGEEFNAVNESGSRVMLALKDSLGVTSGELRKMAFAGELTTDILTKALLEQSSTIANEFEKLPVTIDKALTDLKTQFSQYAKGLNESVDITGKLSDGISLLANNIDTVIKVVTAGVAIKLLAPTLNSIGTSALVGLTGVSRFGIGLTAVNVKAALLEKSLLGLRGGMALLGGPAGIAILAAYGIYELVTNMDELSGLSDETVTKINQINNALEKKTDFSNIEQAQKHYKSLRNELIQLETVELRRAQSNDALNSRYGTTDGNGVQSRQLKEQINALKGRITLSEKLNEIVSKLTTATDKYAKSIKDKEIKAIKESNDAKKLRLKLEKEHQRILDNSLSLVAQYGTEQERIAIVEKERNDLIKVFNEHGITSQSVINALNKKYDEQVDAIKGVKKETKGLSKEKGHLLDIDKQERDLIESGYQAYLDLIDNLEEEEKLIGLTTFEREKAILKRQLEAQEIYATSEELERLLKLRGTEKGFSKNDTFASLGQQGQTLGQILKTAGEGFKNGLESSLQSMNILLQGAEYLVNVWDSTAGKDDAGRVLTTLQQVSADGYLGPVAQAIAQIAGTIDNLVGGRLLGTAYTRESSSINFDLVNGGGGNTTTTDVRQRSLFRGRQWKTEVDALTGDALDAIRKIFTQVEVLAQQTATAVGGIATDIINASFSQQYDKDGNLTSSQSTIDGRTYNDPDLQAFASRVFAEQIISVLDTVLPQVESQIQNYIYDPEFGEIAFGTSTQLVGEATSLAEQFRDQGAQALLDFAQFAVLAVSDIQNGSELLATLTGNLAIVQELQKPGEQLAETYQRIAGATAVLTDAYDVMGISTDATREEVIRLASSLSEIAGGVQEFAGLWQTYFSEFYTPEELRLQSINNQSELLGQQATALGIDPSITQEQFRELFESQLALGNLSEEQQVQYLQFAGTLSRVNNLIEEQNQLERERATALAQSIAEYNDYSTSLKRQLDDINGVNNSLNDISATYHNNVNQLNDLAIAAGRAGASTQDLANAHALYVAQIRQATQALFDQLYGDELDAQIAELEATQTTAINNVASASNSLFDGWTRAIDNLRDYTRSRLVDDFSPLEATDRLAQAQADFNAALAAAQGGDLGAAQSLIGLAQTVDQLNVAVNASGQDYNDIYYAIQDGLNSVNIPNGISDNIVTGNFGGSSSNAELEALYAERDARLAEQTAQQRLELATQLAEHLNALALAVNQPLFEVADQIGLNMNDLVSDLGVNLDELTVASVQNLANIANLLGVELTDLTDNLNDGVSEALGDLANAQSLLNDALEGSITDLPQEYTDLLAPLLRDVETAADGTAQEQALAALELATSGLPIEYRNELAPYFDSIDPTTELQEQITIASRQVDILLGIKDNLGAQNTAQGIPSYAIGTSYVPKDTIANIHKGEIIIDPQSSNILRRYGINAQVQNNSNPEMIKAFDKMSQEIRSLKYQLRQLNDSNDAIANNTSNIDDKQDEIIDSNREKNINRTACSSF